MGDETIKIDDEHLLAKFVAGEEWAYNELVKRYYKQIYQFLVRFLGRPDLAEDLVQEVFVKVYKSAGTFDPEKKFKPWIYSIAANQGRDSLRSRSREDKQVIVRDSETQKTVSLAEIIPDDNPPEASLIETEEKEKVKRALDEMPDMFREILVLAYYDQLSYKDISDSLGIPLGTVKSRLHKAVSIFGEIWRRYEQGMEE
jgi:RNA polymerase sigma-70 factor (ECF subfamily)